MYVFPLITYVNMCLLIFVSLSFVTLWKLSTHIEKAIPAFYFILCMCILSYISVITSM